MTTTQIEIPTAPGTPFEGGFYVARFRLADAVYALIASPAAGDLPGQWLGSYTDVPGARSFNDGAANTAAMAEAGSALAQSVLGLQIDGVGGWYLPSRDELELLYRYLKPTAETNYTYRSGENPSALPATYPYEETSPVQTSATAFQEGGEHALQAEAYFSSTQYSRDGAWFQDFDDGNQHGYAKQAKLRARAVRRFKVE